jgi:ADP-ribosyl-[dinitrogen reductase] hydrolase
LGTEVEDLIALISQSVKSAIAQESGEAFANRLGCTNGIGGYIYHTVPIVIQIWLRHQQDYQQGIIEIIRLGGDTDTTAAILGGIIGAAVGRDRIPQSWLQDLWEYPRTVKWMESLGGRLTEVVDKKTKQPALPLPIYLLLLRNLFFLAIVLFHGFCRLLRFY